MRSTRFPAEELKESLEKMASSGITSAPEKKTSGSDDMPSLEERVKTILGITEKDSHRNNNMLFFVMYDIESNKVRRMVAKYLLEQGCHRIQKSIFLANLSPETYRSIKDDLTEIQSFYDNDDSIIVTPVPSDNVKSMKIIGKTIDIDLITRHRTTLFL